MVALIGQIGYPALALDLADRRVSAIEVGTGSNADILAAARHEINPTPAKYPALPPSGQPTHGVFALQQVESRAA